MKTPSDYLRELNITGTLPSEEIYNLIRRLELIEYEVGVSREFVNTAANSTDGILSPFTEPLRSFIQRVKILRGTYQTYVDYPQPPDDYLKEELAHKMAHTLGPLIKFTEAQSFSHGMRTRELKAEVMILMHRSEDGRYPDPSPQESEYPGSEETS